MKRLPCGQIRSKFKAMAADALALCKYQVNISHGSNNERKIAPCLPCTGLSLVRFWLLVCHDWLIDWLIDCLIDWLIDWLTDWVYCLPACLPAWLTEFSEDQQCWCWTKGSKYLLFSWYSFFQSSSAHKELMGVISLPVQWCQQNSWVTISPASADKLLET